MWVQVGAVCLVLVGLCQLLGTKRVFQGPLLVGMGLLIWFELLLYFNLRYLVSRFEHLIRTGPNRRKLVLLLRNAMSFTVWKRSALALDSIDGKDKWKNQDESDLFNWSLVRDMRNQLARDRENKDICAVMRDLQACMQKNFGGICNEQLYSLTYFGSKVLIEQFIEMTFHQDNGSHQLPDDETQNEPLATPTNVSKQR